MKIRSATTRHVITIALLACGLDATASYATTTYSYDGNPFVQAQDPYMVGDRITGFITVNDMLPSFEAIIDLSGSLLDYSFDDSVRVWTPANSEICRFTVSTDSLGNIAAWDIHLGEPGEYEFFERRPTLHLIGQSEHDRRGNDERVGDAWASCSSTLFVGGRSWSGDRGIWSTESRPATPETTYIYVGAPFVEAKEPYLVGDNLSMRLKTRGPLPPSLPLTNIRSVLVELTYSDGVYQEARPDICQMLVATDHEGRITDWDLGLASPHPPIVPPPPPPGFRSQSPGSDATGEVYCGQTPALATSAEPGIWAREFASVEVPQLSLAGLLTLAGLLLAAGLLALRRPI